MTTATENILSTVFSADDSITDEQRRRVLQILKGEDEEAPQAPSLRLLKRGEVAEILGVTPQAVDYYCRNHWLEKTTFGSQSRSSGITEEALREFLRGNKIPKKNTPKNKNQRIK